jgi:Caspase recruitment domain
MEEVHRDVLRTQLTYLQKNLIPLEVACLLFEANILNDSDIERINAEPVESARVSLLIIHMLPRRGPKAYPELLKSLEKTKQGHVESFLQETETKLQEKKTKDGKYSLSSSQSY